MRVITLNDDNEVIGVKHVREDYLLQENEIQSDIGDLGQIMQPNGTFYTPEHPPIEPSETLEDKINRIEEANLILMDALATTYEEVIMLRMEIGGTTK